MFRPLPVSVVSTGEHVVLTISNSSWTLHYETALKLAWNMRQAAIKAKRFSGDMTRVWSVLGRLHDAEKGPDHGQPFTPGKVYPVARNVLQDVSAQQVQGLVAVRLGRDNAQIPYRAAFAMSQWLRLRAKESKRRAGDTAHWGALVNVD